MKGLLKKKNVKIFGQKLFFHFEFMGQHRVFSIIKIFLYLLISSHLAIFWNDSLTNTSHELSRYAE